MNLKDLIDGFILINGELALVIEGLNKKSDADSVINEYRRLIEKTNFNFQLGLSFAYVLEFCSSPALCEEFTRSDVQRLFQLISKVQTQAESVYLLHADFEYSVMHDEIASRKIIDSAIERLNNQIRELEKYRDE
jgi:hypothetical protein